MPTGETKQKAEIADQKKCKNGQKQNTGRLPNYCWNTAMADTQRQSSKE